MAALAPRAAPMKFENYNTDWVGNLFLYECVAQEHRADDSGDESESIRNVPESKN